MTQRLIIHAEDPQLRLIHQVARVLLAGGVIIYPTDSAYALGCQIGNKVAMEKIRRIRHLEPSHNFTLICRDLADLATYAHVDNSTFRILKAYTPGPYTFILSATKEVPRRLQHPKRKTIGLRVPDNRIAQAILAELGQPMLSVTLQLPGDEYPLADSEEIFERMQDQVELIIDGGSCGLEPTTVVELVSGVPEVVRIGKGEPEPFM